MNCCSLCEKIYLSEEKFNIYLCYDCHNKTSFCMNCDKIMSKIFNNTNIFKCAICNKITPAISKDLAERESVPESNMLENLSAINDINENRINLNNNLNLVSPNENRLIYPLNGNKTTINTPSTYSSFFAELKNNSTAEKNDNLRRNNYFENNSINLSDMNTQFKINKNFHLINSKNGVELLEDKKKNIFWQLNKSKNINKMKNENKKEFSG